ncbi:MarR family transcriptional regulator [Sinorhizobium sp. CB9]
MATPKNDPVTSIIRGVLSLGRRLRAERPAHSANLSEIGILATLNRIGPMASFRLAAEERLQPQSLTRLLAGLERKGWIRRTRSDGDRREIIIELAPIGRDVFLADIRARRLWLEKAMDASLSAEEREILLRASEIMLKLANADPATDGSG